MATWRHFTPSTGGSVAADAARLRACQDHLVGTGLAGFLVTSLPNIRYLLGFSGTAGLGLITPETSLLITDFRYAEQAPAETGPGVEVVVERRNVWDRLLSLIQTVVPEGGRVGIEEESLSLRDRRRLAPLSGCVLEPVQDLVETMRVVKDPGEVAAITEAITIAESALDSVLPGIHAGQTERSVAARLEMALRERGSEWHPFPTIVASGPRSALPHAGTTDRVIGTGELVLMDFGSRCRGYCADLTRTVVVGAPPDDRQREVYGAVREAQATARTRLRPGMTGREADALARGVLESAGFGDAFGHALGHGIGLEVHESPRLAPTAPGVIPAGAVVTIEPGVYLPGWGGVRLEDDIFLTPEGPRCLSRGAPDLMVLD